MSNEFGEYLRRCRVEFGLSTRSLADRLGVTAAHLSNVERGLSWPLKPHYYRAICLALPTADVLLLEAAAERDVVGRWAEPDERSSKPGGNR